MSRPRQKLIIVSGILVATRPLHVGGFGEDVETDLPLARNGQGEFYVPGSSFTGPIASWVRDSFSEDIVQQLFGFQLLPGAAATASEGHASLFVFEDAPVDVKQSPVMETYDGVGIDRETGAAADRIKFDRAVLPKGTKLPFRMVVEVPVAYEELPEQLQTKDNAGVPIISWADPAIVQAVTGHLMTQLSRNGLHLGACTTRGLGHLCLQEQDRSIIMENWGSRDGIINLLGARLAARSLRSAPSAAQSASWDTVANDLQQCAKEFKPEAPEHITWTISWKPVGPLMSKAPHDGMAVDMLPFVSAIDKSRVSLGLTGSSIKGTLRQRAECLIRTAQKAPDRMLKSIQDPAGNIRNERLDHLEQLAVPFVTSVFGQAKSRNSARGSRGLLHVAPCYTQQSITTEKWQNIAFAAGTDVGTIQNAGGDSLNQKIQSAELAQNREGARIGNAYLIKSDHVSVDRWISAPVDGMLYSTLQPFNFTWDPIQLTLQLPRRESTNSHSNNADDSKSWVALVLLVIRELIQQRLPLGFGANRGFGSIEVSDVQCTVESTNPNVQWLGKLSMDQLKGTTTPGTWNNLTEDERESVTAMAEAWKSAITPQQNELEEVAQ